MNNYNLSDARLTKDTKTDYYKICIIADEDDKGCAYVINEYSVQKEDFTFPVYQKVVDRYRTIQKALNDIKLETDVYCEYIDSKGSITDKYYGLPPITIHT